MPQGKPRHSTYSYDHSFDIPAAPSGMPDVSMGDASAFDHEINTSTFEDLLVRQVQDIVNIRQQGPSREPQSPVHCFFLWFPWPDPLPRAPSELCMR